MTTKVPPMPRPPLAVTLDPVTELDDCALVQVLPVVELVPVELVPLVPVVAEPPLVAAPVGFGLPPVE